MPMKEAPMMKVSPRNPSKMQELEAAFMASHATNAKCKQLGGGKPLAPPTLPTLKSLQDRHVKMNTDILDRDDYFYRRPTMSNSSTTLTATEQLAVKSPRLESISPREGNSAIIANDSMNLSGSTVSSPIANTSFSLPPSLSQAHPLDSRSIPAKASFSSGRASFLDRKPSRHESIMNAKEIVANQRD